MKTNMSGQNPLSQDWICNHLQLYNIKVWLLLSSSYLIFYNMNHSGRITQSSNTTQVRAAKRPLAVDENRRKLVIPEITRWFLTNGVPPNHPILIILISNKPSILRVPYIENRPTWVDCCCKRVAQTKWPTHYVCQLFSHECPCLTTPPVTMVDSQPLQPQH